MKKYFIIRSDGSSIFSQAYERDFIFHCLIKLLDTSGEQFRLLEVDSCCKFVSVQLDRGTGDESPVLAFLRSEEQ